MLIPFAVWSLFYSGINVAQKIAAGEAINWIGMICRFFVGKAAAPLYYIVVLFQLTILTPFLVKIIVNKGIAEKLFWLVTPAYLIYVYAWNFTTGSEPFLYETFFPAWFCFYYLGIKVKCGMKLKGNIVTLVAAFLFSCGEALLLKYYGMGQGFYTSQITVGSFLYSFAFIAVILRERNVKDNIISRIGDCSYGIFYIHMFILMLTGKIININDDWIFYWCVRFILTSLISYGIVRISQRLLHKDILKRIGFI